MSPYQSAIDRRQLLVRRVRGDISHLDELTGMRRLHPRVLDHSALGEREVAMCAPVVDLSPP